MDVELDLAMITADLLALGLAIALWIWLIGRIRIEPPQELRGRLPALAFGIRVWAIRLFALVVVLLTAVTVLSFVTFLLQDEP